MKAKATVKGKSKPKMTMKEFENSAADKKADKKALKVINKGRAGK